MATRPCSPATVQSSAAVSVLETGIGEGCTPAVYASFLHQEDDIIVMETTFMLLILSLLPPIMLGLYELINMSSHLVLVIIINHKKLFAPKISIGTGWSESRSSVPRHHSTFNCDLPLTRLQSPTSESLMSTNTRVLYTNAFIII